MESASDRKEHYNIHHLPLLLVSVKGRFAQHLKIRVGAEVPANVQNANAPRAPPPVQPMGCHWPVVVSGVDCTNVLFNCQQFAGRE